MKKSKNYFFQITLLILTQLLFSCAGLQEQQCPTGTQNLPGCPPDNAVNDETVNKLYASRTWLPPGKLTIDPIKKGEDARIPVNQARAKLIGPTFEDSLTSLAIRIWMIENAQHTVDVMYFIFERDLVGYAVLGALCNAVRRGVDVRIMVDSLGSMHPSHNELRALETCADEAGFMRNAKGQVTTKKARVQTVIFNALSKFQFNRRSHDKIIIVDGHFHDKAVVITGGRNISRNYYGLEEDGSQDHSAYRDLDILVKANKTGQSERITVGSVSEIYYTLLFLHKGNKRLYPLEDDDEEELYPISQAYSEERKKSQEKLAFLKSLPEIKKRLEDMPRYMSEGFRNSEVRLAHQLSNLTAEKVTTKALENIESNPNSIMYLIKKIVDKRFEEGVTSGTIRMVSPYIFTYKYYNEAGDIVFDEAQEILKMLRDNPDITLEVITNSVMTGDNSATQSLIDIDMVPRFLLTPELQEVWRSDKQEGELNPQVVESDEWKKLINHPQIFFYEMGKLDSVLLGGSKHYGKLHAKFILGEQVGFIGTSNFDYRSNLYNSEMGYFFKSPELRQDLLKHFEWLKSNSYRWGTPEWLQMRKELMAGDSKKSGSVRKQRGIYNTIKFFGIVYLM